MANHETQLCVPPLLYLVQEAFSLLDRGKAAAERMITLAPKDPTSHYALVKIYNTLGELPDALAKLEDCLAASEALGAPYNAALYATSVGFCSVEVSCRLWGACPGET